MNFLGRRIHFRFFPQHFLHVQWFVYK